VSTRAVLIAFGLGAAFAVSGCRCSNGVGQGEELGMASSTGTPSDSPESRGRYIVVDQLGYLPGMSKIAVLVDPARGFNEQDAYVPGRVLEVRRQTDDAVVWQGAPQPWNGGGIDAHSGDRGAWLDFSALTAEGSFYVFDPERNARGASFEIRKDVYRGALRAAVRAFYFNRANVEKRAPYACAADKCWTLAADHVGPRQDGEARSLDARSAPETARDLRGGWWDAGDTNKYVTFASAAVHQLLSAYSARPSAFGDDFGIPESHNGVPDVLDEVLIELAWLEKMQASDLGGGTLLKLGNVEFEASLPDRSPLPRYYIPKACSSATIAVAGMFAHAAVVLGELPALEPKSRELFERAERAFSHFRAHALNDACDDGTLTGGDADWSLEQQRQAATVAAIYLWSASGREEYGSYVAESYSKLRPFADELWSTYEPAQGDALVFYATRPSADEAVTRAITERAAALSRRAPFAWRADDDLYRAFLPTNSFHWGSNKVRANLGNATLQLEALVALAAKEDPPQRERAEGLLHFFHGVNALGLVYLSNMGSHGAERSVTQMFHTWFRDGDALWDSATRSELGPAPGFLVGGPNRQYCQGKEAENARCRTSELTRQPPEKAYLDFNTGYAPDQKYDRAWELSEPGIYYQAAYVQLLSSFVE
jgi:hypothetical protein